MITDKITKIGKLVHFGEYDVDLVGRELRKGGIRIKLQPKPFRVLTILLERAGTSISRDDLKKLLWAPDTFVDFDHALNTAINRIRESLNGDAISGGGLREHTGMLVRLQVDAAYDGLHSDDFKTLFGESDFLCQRPTLDTTRLYERYDPLGAAAPV